MMPGRLRSRRLRRAAHAAIALAASTGLLVLLGAGYGEIPALGPALVPGRGAWTSAAGGKLPVSQTLATGGLTRPVQVWFTSQGVPSIRATSDSDLFLALGYVHAEFRLAEMDLVRRLAEGRLAQLVGPAAVASDEFELRLGLLRTAEQEWAEMPRSSPAAQALIAYSRGVNDYLASARASGQWPAVFSLAGVYPASWPGFGPGARAASAILADVAGLPAGQVYANPESNAWAVNGPKVAGGGGARASGQVGAAGVGASVQPGRCAGGVDAARPGQPGFQPAGRASQGRGHRHGGRVRLCGPAAPGQAGRRAGQLDLGEAA